MSSAIERPDPGLPPPELLDSAPVRVRDRPSPPEPPGPPDPRAADGRGPRSSRRVWVWCVVAAALVVTSLVWVGDQRARAHEAAALSGCERRLSNASAWSEIQMGSLVNYLRTSPGSGQLHLADLMSGPARSVLPRVQRAHRSCDQVRVEPWHFALVSRRNAALAYSGALITLLETVASQGRAFVRHDPTLIRLRQAAGID